MVKKGTINHRDPKEDAESPEKSLVPLSVLVYLVVKSDPARQTFHAEPQGRKENFSVFLSDLGVFVLKKEVSEANESHAKNKS